MKHYIALDHGGTATRGILFSDRGKIINISNDSSLYKAGERRQFSWLEHVSRLLCTLYKEDICQPKDCAATILSLNGVNNPQDVKRAAKEFSTINRFGSIRIVNDSIAALRGCHPLHSSDGIEVVLCAGSGLNCAVRCNGERPRSLGWRILAEDQGGYAIGRRIWLAAMDAFNGLGEKTVLVDMLLSAYHRKSFARLIDDISTGHVRFCPEELAPLLYGAVLAGDAVASDIVKELSARWIKYVEVILREQKVQKSSPIDLYLSGGIFVDCSNVMRKGIEEAIIASQFELHSRMACFPPIVGAALLLLDIICRDQRTGCVRDEFLNSPRIMFEACR